MEQNTILEIFGRELITHVRDETLQKMNLIESGHMKSMSSLKLHKKYNQLSEESKEILEDFIKYTVDLVIHNFLWMIEQDDNFDLISLFNCKDEYVPDSLKFMSDGLCGELYTEDGWIHKYSKYPSSLE